MDQIYLKIWELAKPYYKKGRTYDIDQVEWMMRQADQLADVEKMDKALLLPLVILHDVGYYKIKDKNPHIKEKVHKKIHLIKGAKIARKILGKIGYEKELAEKIIHCISVHDNWVFGDNKPFQENKEMALFNDLDFLWVTSSFEAFKITGASICKNPREFYKFWEKDEKLTNRPFCCPSTQRMWEVSMKEIKKHIK